MRFMRSTSTCAAAALAAACLTGGTAAQEDKGNQVMAQTRKALGGDDKLAAVKALSLRATYQREFSMPGMAGGSRATVMLNGAPASGGNQQITGDIEVDVEL